MKRFSCCPIDFQTENTKNIYVNKLDTRAGEREKHSTWKCDVFVVSPDDLVNFDWKLSPNRKKFFSARRMCGERQQQKADR